MGGNCSFKAQNEAAISVEYNSLTKAVRLLAACAEIATNWQTGMRHDLAMAFSGLAFKQGLNITLVSKNCRTNLPTER